ncbi:hypothetical protein ACQPZ8_30015 [Actinomadura nitritigenes]|uniref:hypothetical protein n=1 Tax=Actinomadura nitritigenes TaxID=134602 RepID=UPI003D8DC2D2
MNTLAGHTARENLVQAAAVAAGGPGEAPVDVDPIGRDAEREQLLGLDDDILDSCQHRGP